METTIVNMSTSLPNLRRAQVECLEKIEECLTEQDQGLVEMFCGTGKSLIEFKTLSSYATSVIIFPSFLLHKVEPVTKGIRNSLVIFSYGPPFC